MVNRQVRARVDGNAVRYRDGALCLGTRAKSSRQQGDPHFAYAGDAGVHWDDSQVVFYANSVYTEARSSIQDTDYAPSGREGLSLKGMVNAQSFLVRDLSLYKIEIQEDLGNNDYHQLSVLNIHHNGSSSGGYEDVMFLGITKAEYTALIGTTGLSEYHDRYPYLEMVGGGVQEDREGIEYYKFRLGMIGIDSNREWAVSFPTSETYVYSGELMAFASEAYSDDIAVYNFPSVGKDVLHSLLSRFKEYPQEIGLMSWGANKIHNSEITWEEFENWFVGESEGADGEYVPGIEYILSAIKYQKREMPTYQQFVNSFPKEDYPGHPGYYTQLHAKYVYPMVGGELLALYNANGGADNRTNPYRNACTVRWSLAMNRLGYLIPNNSLSRRGADVSGATRYYYIVAVSANDFMEKTFGPPDHKLEGSSLNNLDSIKDFLRGKTGIYIVINKDATRAGYTGHVDLIQNGHVPGRANVENVTGGLRYIKIWEFKQ